MLSGYIRYVYDHLKSLFGDVPVEELLKGLEKDITDDLLLPWKHGIPMVLSSFFDRDDNYMMLYEDNNIPVFDSPEKAARAMSVLNSYRIIRERQAHEAPSLPKKTGVAESIIAEALKEKRGSLDEHESKLLLQSYGIPVTKEILILHQNEIARASKHTGFPLVMKACSSEILHKTERGLVHLNLKDLHEADDAYRRIQENAPGVPVIVYKMVRGTREFIAGMSRRAGFGPCVLFGLGGIYTEALRDIAFRVAPLSHQDAEAMIGAIKAQKILGEFRSMPPVNKNAVAGILQALSFIPLLHPEIAEIDLNPILIENTDPVVVDALITLQRG